MSNAATRRQALRSYLAAVKPWAVICWPVAAWLALHWAGF